MSNIKETTPKERQLPLTSIVNFLNEKYSVSNFTQLNNIKFKILNEKRITDKSNKKIINISKCPSVIDFVKTFNQNKLITVEKSTKDGIITQEKQISMKELKNYIFDFDIRAIMDIIENYPKFCDIDENTGESILTSHILNNIDLPKYVPISVPELFNIMDKYFLEELYVIKLINNIYPHSEKESKGKGLKTIYIQRIPKNVKDTLRLIAEGKSLEEVIEYVQENIKINVVLPGKLEKLLSKSKSIKESILNSIPFNNKEFFNKLTENHSKYKLQIDEKKHTINTNTKKLISQELHKYLRELSQVKYLYNTIMSAIEYHDIDKSELNTYYDRFVKEYDRMNSFFKNSKYDRKSSKDFLKYFIDTLNLCFDVFNIPNEVKKISEKKEVYQRVNFINHFLKTIDTNKRIKLSKDCKKDIVTQDYKMVINKYREEINKIISPNPYGKDDHKKLVSFFYNLGKNSFNPERGDRITREMYIALGLTIIKYIQKEVYKEIYAHIKSNDITIYITK